MKSPTLEDLYEVRTIAILIECILFMEADLHYYFIPECC